MANYGFREMTTDIDAVIEASSAMKDAINRVGDRYNLPNRWLNADFRKTSAYSNKLSIHSEHYRTYSNVLNIRTVKAEYLVAMKLVSGRRYKKDLSDIVGVLNEQQKQNEPLSFEAIDRAMNELYGSWELVDPYAKALLEKALACEDLSALFSAQMEEEMSARESILEIDKMYPDLVTQDNINDIIEKARRKKKE